MKICHIIIANFYIEGAGYQENLLPKFHKLLGYDVSIVTNTNDWEQTPVTKEYTYNNSDSIPVTVLATEPSKFKKIPKLSILYNLVHNRIKGLLEFLNNDNPDIIFIHGCQNIANLVVLKYLKNHRAILFIDNHADYYNGSLKKFTRRFLAKQYYGRIARRLYSACKTFWGVTPWRVDYLRNVYGLPADKTKLLIMGGDDEKIDFENKQLIRSRIRSKYNIKESDVLIITGGKIDRTKNIHHLIESTQNTSNVKILIFGKPSKDFEDEFNIIIQRNNHSQLIGWIRSEEVYDYFLAADLVVFPGTHSVLWEQAAACGTPCVVKHWKGMEHININGNCEFIEFENQNPVTAISHALLPILNNRMKIKNMTEAAIECRKHFLYSTIAKNSISTDR